MTLVITIAIFFDVLLVGVFLVLLFSADNSTLVDRLTQLGAGGAPDKRPFVKSASPAAKKLSASSATSASCCLLLRAKFPSSIA